MSNELDTQAMVVWSWQDVQSIKTDWTQEECEVFMTDYRHDLEDRLVEEGWNIMRDLLSIKKWKEEK